MSRRVVVELTESQLMVLQNMVESTKIRLLATQPKSTRYVISNLQRLGKLQQALSDPLASYKKKQEGNE